MGVHAVSSARLSPGHLLEVMTDAGTIVHLRIGTGDAGEILRRAGTIPPQLSSMDVLRVAVGAIRGFSLCNELAEYYYGSEGQVGCSPTDWRRGILQHRDIPLP